MDFGAVGFDGFVCSEVGFAPFLSEAETKEKWRRSGLSKQGRSEPVEDDWRGLKMARQEDFGLSKAMLMQSKNPSMLGSGSLFSDGQQQLLSFSSPKSDGVLIGSDRSVDRRYQNELLPYHLTSTFGLRSGSLNGNMHCGTLSGVRGPFTPSQWMELEHQALIYKYLTSNVPIPSNLLIPIRGSLNPSGFSVYTAGCLRPNSLGWGSFQMDYSGNTDPEPGRCRRTDGKKWRCSRDAVADQKYCERHMNRGRHRSRKPVEGQTGHASSATDATIKTMPAITSSSPSTIPSCLKSNSLPISQQLMKSLRPDVDSSSTHGSRILMNKMNVDDQMQDPQSLSVQSTIYPKPKDTLFPNPKQNVSFADSSNAELGLVNSNSLLNPHRGSYDHNDQDSQSHPLRHFIDDWPKSRSDHSTITWPYLEEIQMDKTQLSISIPVASAEFSSSTSSPTKEKLTLSPLKLSHELDPIQMNLGVGGVHESTERDANWMPISWKTSMGGPLGEVLNNTSNTSRCQKNSSTLDLMTEGWDGNPQVGSSPTGVLQKTSFAASLSNSSTGSSPRTEVNKSHDHISLCDDLLGSTLVT